LLEHLQVLILQSGLAHLSFECVYNGIMMPRMVKKAQEEESKGELDETAVATGTIPARSPSPARAKTFKTWNSTWNASKQLMQRRQNVGLRPDIWVHHGLALGCFAIVLSTGEFLEEAVMLTAVETTCALPVAFGQVIWLS
jgi:hypothetical protein